VQVKKLKIENFRGINAAELEFNGHTLLVGRNNVGKSTICEALELALGPDRQSRFPVVEEFDFYNALYLDNEQKPVPIRIEVLLTDVSASVQKACANYLDRWNTEAGKLVDVGEIEKVDHAKCVWALRLLTIARYNAEEDEFEAATHYVSSYDPEDEDGSRVPKAIKRLFGFLYLRTLRTGSRALTLERNSLLDMILRLQSLQTGIWEDVRNRLENLDPPIDAGAEKLGAVLETIEERLAEYIPMDQPGSATRIFVSQLTREHLRKTLSFFLSLSSDQKPVPFQDVGTGTLNTLVLALLTFIAELKKENVIFAMEEPEIALPPHTQRRIAEYLLGKTTQCFVTSHSPYVIESFNSEQIILLRRGAAGAVTGKQLDLSGEIKAKTYRRHVRRGLAEAMLGCGVILTEGITEAQGLAVCAEKLEASDTKLYPLDIAGVTIFNTDGDGSAAEFGRFFVSLDLPAFAFLDKKNRPSKEKENIDKAGFQLIYETPYEGMEQLLAAEVPLDHQWTCLENLRDKALAPKTKIPAARPEAAAIRELTTQTLKDAKGWGRAAELVDRCKPGELPETITKFLCEIYKKFPRPKPPEKKKSIAEARAAASG